MSQFYERWEALPRGAKFRTPGRPGEVYMKTSRGRGHKVVSLTDGGPNRIPNLANPLRGFDAVIEVIDFKALADGTSAAIAEILNAL